ncbi:aminoglycoside phosphotransferase family protein [Desulfobacterota bacterium M19]
MELLIKNILQRAGMLAEKDEFSCQSFGGDGSERRFFRCRAGQRSLIVILPSPTLSRAKAEARASFFIGRHLYDRGVAVPRPYAYDEESAGVVFEDIGTVLLYDEVSRSAAEAAAIKKYYAQALSVLITFQIRGRQEFNPDFCWDTKRYDRGLMLERECHYFTGEFCLGYMAVSPPAGLEDDFSRLVKRVSLVPADYLLHRDFQSRNLMIQQNEIKIIDFQGSRLGPLAYDLASLLNDPYINLAHSWRRELLSEYIRELTKYAAVSELEFMDSYYHIALLRNLQVLGAYSFLSRVRGKLFFKRFIAPAFSDLQDLLRGELKGVYPRLQRFVTGLSLRGLQAVQVIGGN